MHNILVGDRVRFRESANRWIRGHVVGIEIRREKITINKKVIDRWIAVIRVKDEMSNEQFILSGDDLDKKEILILHRSLAA